MKKQVAEVKTDPVIAPAKAKRNDWKKLYKSTADSLDKAYKTNGAIRADCARLRKEMESERRDMHGAMVRQLRQMSVWDRLKIAFYGPAE